MLAWSWLLCVVLFAVICSCSDSDRSNSGPKLDASVVLARYDSTINALGDPYWLRNYRFSGMFILGQSDTGRFAEWNVPGKGSRREAIVSGTHIISGTCGRTSWDVASQKLNVYSESMDDTAFLFDSLINAGYYWGDSAFPIDVEFEGVSEQDESAVYSLAFSSKLTNLVRHLKIDTSSYLILLQEQEQDGRKIYFRYSDHRELEGAMIPFRSEAWSDPSSTRFTLLIDEVDLDVSIPDSLYEVPDDYADVDTLLKP